MHSFLLGQHNAFPSQTVCCHVALWQRHTLCGDSVFSAETSEALTTFFECSGEAEIVILFLIMLETYQKFLSVHYSRHGSIIGESVMLANEKLTASINEAVGTH